MLVGVNADEEPKPATATTHLFYNIEVCEQARCYYMTRVEIVDGELKADAPSHRI